MSDRGKAQDSRYGGKKAWGPLHIATVALEVVLVLALVAGLALVGRSIMGWSSAPAAAPGAASQAGAQAAGTQATVAPAGAQGGESAVVVPTAAPPAAEPSGGPAPTSVPSDASSQDGVTEFSVYFMRGDKIGAAHREVPKTEAVGAAAVEALLEGPNEAEKEAGLSTSIPSGTKFLGLSIDNKIATVDLSKEYESGGGSTSMAGRLAQVVFTLTQFPTVEKVQFELDGQAVGVFGGEGIVMDHPVGRDGYEGLTPLIFVESPAVGDTVQSPVRIWGTANTFEGTFMVDIVDGNGNIIVEQYATATSGSGTRGTFDISIPFLVQKAGSATLTLFELSAKDGSRVNVVEIPVRLVK